MANIGYSRPITEPTPPENNSMNLEQALNVVSEVDPTLEECQLAVRILATEDRLLVFIKSQNDVRRIDLKSYTPADKMILSAAFLMRAAELTVELTANKVGLIVCVGDDGQLLEVKVFETLKKRDQHFDMIRKGSPLVTRMGGLTFVHGNAFYYGLDRELL